MLGAVVYRYGEAVVCECRCSTTVRGRFGGGFPGGGHPGSNGASSEPANTTELYEVRYTWGYLA